MRAKIPDEDDWGKLKCILKYLNGTKYLKLRLTVENLAVLKWYCGYGSQYVHWDCKGRRSGVLVGTRSDLELLEKAQVEHKEFNRNGTGDSGHVRA